MNSRIARIGGLVVLMVIRLFAQSHAQAQDDDPFAKNQIYFTGVNLINLSWANDSRRFVFHEDGSIVGLHTAVVHTFHQTDATWRFITEGKAAPLGCIFLKWPL